MMVRCAVCGVELSVSRFNATALSGWVRTLVIRAQEKRLSLKDPHSGAMHDKCKNQLAALIENKKDKNNVHLSSGSGVVRVGLHPLRGPEGER